MLVVARKEGQRIVIPSIDTIIEICRVRGDTVRVGIEAPKEILVLRQELVTTDCESSLFENYKIARKINHDLRGKLHAAGLGVSLLKSHFQKASPPQEIIDTMDLILRAVDVTQEHAVPEWKPTTALLVEDDRNERELLAGFLRMHGYEVETKEDGEHALNYIESGNTPDVVLLDMGLPDLSGSEVADRIREHDEKMKIFVISGQEANSQTKADRWFQKPLNPAVLLQDLQNIKAG